MPNKPTPAELIELLLANAERLRKAGVFHVKLDGLEAHLQPHLEPFPALGPTPAALGFEAAEAPTSAVNDPQSFAGRPMPTLKRPGQSRPGGRS